MTKVGHDDTVVEGGTGTMGKETKIQEDYTGTTPKQKKKILITGKNSYIGESIKKNI
ncbi:MAG: hypothetical protein ACLVGL_03790 [Waltera sp.]